MKSGGAQAQALRRLGKNKSAMAGFILFALISLACIFAPCLTHWGYGEFDIPNRLSGPSRAHILGTDNFGRDVFSRLLYGGRVTLGIAFFSTFLASSIGSVIGLIAGYFGSRVDYWISPLLNTLASVPAIILALVFEAVFSRGHGYFMYAIVIAAIPQFARLIRASVINIMGREYIAASQALGLGHFGIILRHILPNVAPTLMIRITGGVSESLLICTVMGYLMIGIRPPIPEWGGIIQNAYAFIRLFPHMMIIPCAVVSACVISINLFGNGLRDAFDPRD